MYYRNIFRFMNVTNVMFLGGCFSLLFYNWFVRLTMKKYVAAIDQGTTSTRFIIFDHGGSIGEIC